jgi:hypothetical protein
MKIEIDCHQVDIKSLVAGDVFEYGDNYYIRTDFPLTDRGGAVRLKSGQACVFDGSGTTVTKHPNAELRA